MRMCRNWCRNNSLHKDHLSFTRGFTTELIHSHSLSACPRTWCQWPLPCIMSEFHQNILIQWIMESFSMFIRNIWLHSFPPLPFNYFNFQSHEIWTYLHTYSWNPKESEHIFTLFNHWSSLWLRQMMPRLELPVAISSWVSPTVQPLGVFIGEVQRRELHQMRCVHNM